MRHLRHLLAFDLRRFRLLMAAWLLVVVAGAALAGARPLLAVDPALGEPAALSGSLLWLAELLLLLLIVALVVQVHPPVGSDAFWMTRPIPPLALLAAKVILLGALMVAAPVTAEAVSMAASGIPAGQIAAVAAQTALHRTFWLIVLMAGAALTPNLPRFALLCGAVLAALALVVAVMMTVLVWRMDDTPMRAAAFSVPASGIDRSEDPTPGIVGMLLVVVAGVALVAVQYRTRSRVRSVPAGAAGLILSVLVGSVWPWPLLFPRLEVPPWAAGDSALRLQADEESLEVGGEESPFGRPTEWRFVRARVRLDGIEPGWSADVGVVQARLDLDGDADWQPEQAAPGPRPAMLASPYSAHPTAVPVEADEPHPTRGVLRDVLGVRTVAGFGRYPVGLAILMYLREADLERIGSASGTYRGRFHVRLTRHEVDGTLPLRHGATHRTGRSRLVIDRVERTPGTVWLVLREWSAMSAFDRQPLSHVSFYLRNRRAGQAFRGNEHDLDFVSRSHLFSFFLPGISVGTSTSHAGFRTRTLRVRFPPPFGDEDESVALDEEWLAEAELVVVRSTPQGAVERALEIAGFSLPAGAGRPGGARRGGARVRHGQRACRGDAESAPLRAASPGTSRPRRHHRVHVRSGPAFLDQLT